MPTASILYAAGRGKRLRPLTDTLPKPALPLLDIPLGAWGLCALAEACPPVMVNVRHLAPLVTLALRPYGTFDVLDEQPQAYGTAGTLAALRDRLGPRVVTWNSDLLTDLDPGALILAHERSGAPATAAVASASGAGDFVTEGERAVGFVDRRTESPRGDVRFLGACVFETSALLPLLPRVRPAGLGETVLKVLAEAGDLALHRHDGYARDVGTPGDLLGASLDLLEGKGPPPPRPWPGRIVPVPGGRAYIGPGAIVEGRLGPGAIVLAGARVERDRVVERTIIWPPST